MPERCSRQSQENRVLRRSRYGCRNCKLRKLKCDEGKPQCNKCASFGVLCNFTSNTVADLQPVTEDKRGSFAAQQSVRLQPLVSSAVWTIDKVSGYQYQLDTRCQDLITRYYRSSLITPNDPHMVGVNRKLLELAFTYPFLMHASLAVALIYDRHLSTSSCYHHTLQECHHWYRATRLFNQHLSSKSIRPQDKDPIWGTAAVLAVLSFTSASASTPSESWPLKPAPDRSDLDWIRMSNAKMALWHVVNPVRPDSIFYVLAGTFARMNAPLPEQGTDGIPRELAELCHIDETSATKNNPYFHAAHALSLILRVPDGEITTCSMQLFIGTLRGAFKNLLVRSRDPVALLLLYLWYRKASPSIWWIKLRARVECPAICTYLRLYHGENTAVQKFLPGGIFGDTSYY